jgi:type II secretory pathway pseudopilin PulG
MSNVSGHDSEFNDAIPKARPRRRVTLIELLVVISIIGIVSGLLLPTNRRARPEARRAQCANNLRQIALALHNYERAYNALPPAHTVDSNGKPLHSWRTLILPYLDAEDIYRSIDLAKPWNDPANAKARETVIGIFRCSETAMERNTTTYLAITARNGCFMPAKARRLADITDDHASTIMVIEAGDENAVPWMAPFDANDALLASLGSTAQLHHTGGTQASFVDGSVLFMKSAIPAAALRALISISGNDDNVAKGW